MSTTSPGFSSTSTTLCDREVPEIEPRELALAIAAPVRGVRVLLVGLARRRGREGERDEDLLRLRIERDVVRRLVRVGIDVDGDALDPRSPSRSITLTVSDPLFVT